MLHARGASGKFVSPGHALDSGKSFTTRRHLPAEVKSTMNRIRSSPHGRRDFTATFQEERNVSFCDFLLCGRVRRALSAQRTLISTGPVVGKTGGKSRIAGILSAILIIFFASCKSAPGVEAGMPVAGIVESRYEVLESGANGDAVIGYVARTRYSFPGGDSVLWLVENAYFQEIGYFDENGRAWRKVAFREDPQWVATGSMEACARALLDAGAQLRLAKLPLDEVPEALRNRQAANASARRAHREFK